MQCAVCSVQRAACRVQCAVCSVQCVAVCSVQQCGVWSVKCLGGRCVAVQPEDHPASVDQGRGGQAAVTVDCHCNCQL